MVRVTRLSFMAQPITETVATAIAMVILWIGARQVLVEGTLSGAELITFLALVMRMLQPLKQLSQVPAVAQQSLAAAERLFEVMDHPVEPDRGAAGDGSPRHRVRRRDLRHDDQPVLRDIAFTRNAGTSSPSWAQAARKHLVDLVPRF
jgi:subfamily B ATP-binding cassette protein MsbA